MVLREEIARLAPALRRAARALCGRRDASGLADEIVRLTARRALAERQIEGDVRLRLYALLVETARAEAGAVTTLPAGGAWRALPQEDHRVPFMKGWEALDWTLREPLVLVGLERLSYGQAADVLGCTHDALVARLTRGRDALASARVAAQGEASGTGRRAAGQARHLRLVK